MDSDHSQQQPIAIVGMACRLPGEVTNADKLWDLLCEGHTGWSEVPESRFQEQSFYHPDSKRNGAFHTRGGHFLEEDISRFDAPFFNISPAAAKAMDPQIRLLLESAYEAFESSGMTLDQLRGTDTAAYVALYNRDYEKILMRDPEDLPFYFQTGNGEAMHSNRLSYFFDLHGPSFTLDTGCSGGLVALHQACQSIRNGESSQAIVGAPNLILDPAGMIGPSFLQFYASDGRSKSFDDSSDGYGRGEGVCTLVLKPLSAAIADSDPVRAVIRSSVINQDGRTTGITVPSEEAQNSLIRSAYAAAGLDPADTSFVEAHGSGTAVGDMTESRSIGAVIGKARDAQGRGPVIMGSVKANIGHLENASGLAAVIKAVLVLTKGKIPQAVNFKRPSCDIQWKTWNVDIPTHSRELDCSQVSVNSFGYGGTNVHLILERPPEKEDACAFPDDRSGSLMFVLSARSNDSVRVRAEQLQEYLEQAERSKEQSFLDSLAYTLSTRRSLFSWRTAVVASSVSGLRDRLRYISYSHHQQPPRIGFVFTGQGAQWATMGKELWDKSSVFQKSIAVAERCLNDLGVDWKLTNELWKTDDETGLNSAVLAQPACTAIQLALVDLLASWNIHPSAVTGHSSGEIAAAYACKAISFRDAILAAYARGSAAGQIAADKSVKGAMIAVGLGPHDVQPYISAASEGIGLAAVACVNSPGAVTVSGDNAAIDILETQLRQDGVFARRLPVDVAYHSHHMLRVAGEYHDALATMELARSNSNISFCSSVSGKVTDGTELGPRYWVQNLVSPVLFSTALEKLVFSTEPQLLVEIGPHSALKGPIRQTLKAGEKEVPYSSTLLRHQRADQCLIELASELFSHGADIEVHKVNSMSAPAQYRACLEDLPTYPWDHSSAFWHESRLSRNYRNREEPPHTLLGVLSPESSWLEPRWRNCISLASHPWLAGHRINGDAVFPATAFMTMAIEAGFKLARQQLGKRQHEPNYSIELGQVSISNKMTIPNSRSVELMFVLRPATELGGRDLARRHEFVIHSCSDAANVVEHCRGFVKVAFDDTRSSLNLLESQFDRTTLPEVPLETWYDRLKQVGIDYNDLFTGLATATAGRGYSSATITSFPPSAEYSASLHPATLDLCLQTMIAATDSTDPIRGPVMPTFMQKVSVAIRSRVDNHSCMRVTSKVKKLSEQKLLADIEGISADGNEGNAILVLSLQGLEATSLNLPFEPAEPELDQVKACQKLVMMLDPDYLTNAAVNEICNEPLSPISVRAKLKRLRDACRIYAQATVQEMSDDDVQRMTPYQKQYMSWLRKQANLCPLGSSSDLLGQLRISDAEGQMVCRVGDSLSAILKGLQDPLSVMVDDNLLYRLYEDDHSMQRCAIQAAEYARMLSLKSPGLRILEIGAGTGGATLPVLEALSRSDQTLCSHYRFTDISVGFFGNVGKKLERWQGLVQYQKLDIEKDPEQQGFEPADYDLVIAANVLHATTYIDKTVKHVRQLLKPGGKLLLLESTQPTVHRSFVFGPLPGWWLGATQRNKDSPLLSEQEWNQTLQSLGFSGLDSILYSYPDVEDQIDSLIISTARTNGTHLTDVAKTALVLTHNQLLEQDKSLGYQVAQHISSKMPTIAVEILPLGDNRVHDRTCIMLTDLDGPFLGNLGQTCFDDLKHILKTAHDIIWVTRGATDQCHNPMSSLVSGMARVLRHENPHVPIATIDLDSERDAPPQDTATKILTFIQQYISSSQKNDVEWFERNGNWCVPRLVEDTTKTEFVRSHSMTYTPSIPQLEPFYQEERPLRLSARHTAGLQGISFIDCPDLEAPLSCDQIEIEVRASGVNFRDIMVSLGQMPDEDVAEVAGVVTKVGRDSQHQFAQGDRVYTWHVPRFASHVRCPSFNVQRIPADVSFEQAASVPIIYNTAYHCLATVAQLRPGETILIHSGAGGVGQAAIVLAQYLGATVFATVGTNKKKQLLIQQYGLSESHIFSSRSTAFVSQIQAVTKGRGVDVVLNALSGAFLQESLDVLAPLGRFVEIGKSDILAHARLDMSIFSRAISISAVDIVQLMREKPQYMADVFARVHQMLAEHQIRPASPLTSFPISELEQVFRTMQKGQHVGKLVVTHGRDDEVKVLPRVSPLVRLRPDATYLIVGGQGGLGRALSVWMAKCGARCIVALSPSGAGRPLTRGLIEELAQMKVDFHAISCDIGDRHQLRAVLMEKTKALPPIHGIVHAGLTLKDSSFDNMTLESFQQVLQPKVTGTYNLHECLQDQPLDFFIMLSSYVGLLGSTGQANYAAASTFQDAFARWRTSLGKPTYSLDLGTVRGASYFHQSPEALAHYEKMGLGGIPLSALHALVGYAMSNPPTHYFDSQVAIGWAPPSTWSPAQYAALDPLVSHLSLSPVHQSHKESRRDSGVDMQETQPLSQILSQCQGPKERTSAIIEALTEQIVDILGVAAEDVNAGKSIGDHGGDSLVAIEFRNWFHKEVGCTFTTEQVTNQLSLEQLAVQAAG
ncbi:ketoacyl-synt-domain-containing protein [Aspergillus steynii IBT 23096]|uniref:Ketoacyl-synt-domain-containing protein n=1 Tax=Aspergillus steynii IBT 23096 TaxID=1392250 RepID=A0A2I2GKA0_9EURO|nr:ketoacyl-synt-domain-containing protein [Aspergillus steynii IBT 23096]PLB53305.1 ketoacyl-synt-domain-containing protein [Aspergillus steynii IBT 23096]